MFDLPDCKKMQQKVMKLAILVISLVLSISTSSGLKDVKKVTGAEIFARPRYKVHVHNLTINNLIQIRGNSDVSIHGSIFVSDIDLKNGEGI